MPYVVWSDMFSINMPFIDNQHKKLINIVNDFHEAIHKNKGEESLFKILNALIKYAEQHFQDEERVMEFSGYPLDKKNEHKKIHEQLIMDIFRLQQEYNQSEEKTIYNLELFLNSWLIEHILTIDKQLEPYCRNIQEFEF